MQKFLPEPLFKKLYTGKEKQSLSKAFGIGLDESFSIGNYIMGIGKMQCVFMKFYALGTDGETAWTGKFLFFAKINEISSFPPEDTT